MKKFATAVLLSVFVICLSLGLAACVPGNLQAHSWSREWKHSFTEHWHECTDPGCSGKTSVAAHDWRLVESMVEESPTCGSAGWGRYVCVMCGATKDDEIPATGEHAYSLLTVADPATCIHEGQELWLCDVCGDLQSRTVPATGEHEFDLTKWKFDEQGHYRVCKNCGEKGETIPHEDIDSVTPEVKNPTGTTDGSRTYRCTCGYVLKTEVIPNLSVAVDFGFSIRRNYDNATVEVTEDAADLYKGKPVLHAEFWSEDSFPQGVDDTSVRAYTISIANSVNANGTTVPMSYAEGRSELRVYIYDEYKDIETRMSLTVSGYRFAGANGGNNPPYTLGIKNYNKNDPTENEHAFIFRYVTISGTGENAVETVRAERMLIVTCTQYSRAARSTASREVAYLEKKENNP